MVSKQKSSKSSVVALGASGKKDMFFFDPEKLTIVKDEKSPIFDDRGLTPAQERLVKSIMQFGVIEPVVIHKTRRRLTSRWSTVESARWRVAKPTDVSWRQGRSRS